MEPIKRSKPLPISLVANTDRHGFGLLKQETPKYADSLNHRSEMKKDSTRRKLAKI